MQIMSNNEKNEIEEGGTGDYKTKFKKLELS